MTTFSPEQQAQVDDIRAQYEESTEAIAKMAQTIDERSCAFYLFGASQSSPLRMAPLSSFELYFEEKRRLICGEENADDPILRMLAEQLILTHHSIGRLHLDGSQATEVEAIRVRYSLAALLIGEFRRLAAQIDAIKDARRLKPLKSGSTVGKKAPPPSKLRSNAA